MTILRSKGGGAGAGYHGGGGGRSRPKPPPWRTSLSSSSSSETSESSSSSSRPAKLSSARFVVSAPSPGSVVSVDCAAAARRRRGPALLSLPSCSDRVNTKLVTKRVCLVRTIRTTSGVIKLLATCLCWSLA
ncbi:hypothetical protein BRADI_2g27208v3 [Brachypodium distachyon]|uniref:Uncharacterized protein n=1 Tax=Brachypodium distachyon TaxID=15368 RepID=A0A0Q3G5H6_BRADI|nr:hypothetical protein BRADI_2g27208v3 [Brachypodium distachyon]PNT71417.1 hypothetical protein BRADI_2g27208v3 [Brachypodium distachyon]